MKKQVVDNQNKTANKIQREPTTAQLKAVSELLLLCSTIRLSSSQKERVSQIIRKKVDWASLLFLAKIQGTAPLLAYTLTNNGFSAYIPPTYLEKMKNISKNTLFKNLFISRQLTTILSAFQQQGISAIPLKGIVLIE